MINKSGDICYRSHTSHCQSCKFFIKDYKCWISDYIPYQTWESCIGYECEYFESSIKNQCNSHYVHPDYEDRELFPIKEYGKGKYRFNSKGERI